MPLSHHACFHTMDRSYARGRQIDGIGPSIQIPERGMPSAPWRVHSNGTQQRGSRASRPCLLAATPARHFAHPSRLGAIVRLQLGAESSPGRHKPPLDPPTPHLKCLNGEAVQRGRTIEQHRPRLHQALQQVHHQGVALVDYLLSVRHGDLEALGLHAKEQKAIADCEQARSRPFVPA